MEIKINRHDDGKRRFGFAYYKNSWYDKYNGKRLFGFNYYNKEKLGFCDFIEVIKEDLLKHISKNRGFICEEDLFMPKRQGIINEKGRYIHFTINYDYGDDDHGFSYCDDINFGVNGICVFKFVKDLLNCANEEYKEWLKEYVDENMGGAYRYVNEDYVRLNGYDEYYGRVDGYEGYYDKECNINKFDKEFTVYSLEVDIYVNEDKIIHKKKFYKSLYDDLMKVAWHPSRYLDWCIDVEELKFLEELWGDED